MKGESVARTYARALLVAAEETGTLAEVSEEVRFFADLLSSERDLRLFLESPRIEKREKRSFIEGNLRGKLTDVFVNFLLVVLHRDRQAFLLEILEHFESLYDERLGRVRAVAITAVPLSPELESQVRSALAESLRKEILLTPRVDPSILGGLIVKFDGMVADGSVRSALERLRASLLAVKLGSELVHED